MDGATLIATIDRLTATQRNIAAREGYVRITSTGDFRRQRFSRGCFLYATKIVLSLESKIEFEIVQPWNPRINSSGFQSAGQVFIVRSELLRVRCIIVGHDNRLLLNSYIAFEHEVSGGDFGWSQKANSKYLSSEIFPNKFGIDIWMTTTVLVEGLNPCQAVLGAKIHDPRDPAADLSPMFRQVVGTLFQMIGLYQHKWRGISQIEDVPTYKYSEPHEPEPFEVDLSALLHNSKSDYTKNKDFYPSILHESLIARIEKELSSNGINSESWVESVYNYSYHYNKASNFEKEQILDSLIPLWNGRTARFIIDTQDMNTEQAELEIQRQADIFLEWKHILSDIYKNSS